MSDFDRILVWGGGAIGGTVAAHLSEAGHAVTLVDIDREHLDAITRDGLMVEVPERRVVAKLSARHRDEVDGRFDLVLLAVKADGTEQAARELLPYRNADAPIVSLQNGLCELQLVQIVGQENVVGGFINFGADIVGPGHIRVGNRGAFVLGELDGLTQPRTPRIRDLLANFEPDAKVSDNILGFLWGKQAYSAVLKSSALSAEPLVAFMTDPRWHAANIALIREVLKVARAEGVRPLGFDGFEPGAFGGDDMQAQDGIERMTDLYRGSSKSHSSAWRDLAVFRQRTDAAAQVTPIIAAAGRHGIAVPLLRGMIDCIGRIENGAAEQGDALVQAWIDGARA